MNALESCVTLLAILVDPRNNSTRLRLSMQHGAQSVVVSYASTVFSTEVRARTLHMMIDLQTAF